MSIRTDLVPCPGCGKGIQPLALCSCTAPEPTRHEAVWDLVVRDMRTRDRIGAEKYGARLQPHNGRDFLQDAYEEALDLAVYLRGAIYERDFELPAAHVEGDTSDG